MRLRAAADGADALICLGDLLLFVDYADHAQGIFRGPVRRGGGPAVRRAAHGEAVRRGQGAVGAACGRARRRPARPTCEAAASRQYAELFAALPEPAYLTYGNVDLPQMWAEHLRPGHQVLDGERVELGGWTFGFVGGGLRSPYRTPNEIDDEVYAAKVAAVGEVDVLCAHIPPAVPDLLYDTVARRMERGSEALLDAIRRPSPGTSCSGTCTSRSPAGSGSGRTECINVGHFRATGQPYVLEW